MRVMVVAILLLAVAAIACGSSGESFAIPTLVEQATVPATDTPPAAERLPATNTPVATAAPRGTTPPSDTPVPLFPEGDSAQVVDIIDGDTIDVDIGGQEFHVRYIGMDTPEQGAPFFEEATEANRELVAGKTVVLVKDVSETDRFGRLLRYVYLPDGTFVNAELVRQGYAVAATFPPDVAHADMFVALEREARDAGRGLWAQPTATSNTSPQSSDA